MLISLCVRSNADTDNTITKNIESLNQDKEFGCFAGIDLFGTENFVYDRVNFSKWLTTMYEELRAN